MSWTDWLADKVASEVVRVLQPVLHAIDARTRVIEKTTQRLEYRMSEVQDVLYALNDATNAVADKQAADTALLEQLKQQLANSDPQAAADLATAIAGMKATTDTLRGLAADQSAPVPPADPIVGEGGDTTAGEPGVDAGDSAQA